MANNALNNCKIKDFYNSSIRGKYAGEYEFNRWFVSSRTRLDCMMTYIAIRHHIKNFDFGRCLEFGPGPGTWTRLIYGVNPKATFDLVDISSEMRRQFFLEMRSQPNVHYIVEDINQYNSNEKYELFFSARSVEYLDDKNLFFKKVHNFLSVGGLGFIITKNPGYGFWKKNADNRFQHSGQISVRKFKSFLDINNFECLGIYPVVIRIPIVDRFYPALSEKIFSRVFMKPLTGRLIPFTESYLVIFRKQ